MTVYARLRNIAQDYPQKPAVFTEDNSLTYAELMSHIDRCAVGMRSNGCEHGDTVAVALPNGLDFVVVAFASFALNCLLAPLNPRFRDGELRSFLDRSNPRAVFFAPNLQGVMGSFPSNAKIRSMDVLSVMAECDAPLDSPGGDDPAIQMLTSGSTAQSKCITRTQNQILAEFDALHASIKLSADDRILSAIPLFHSYGFGNALIAALLSGGQLYLSTTEYNPRKIAGTLQREGITVFPGVPFMYKMLSEARFSHPPTFPRLRLATSAGAPLPRSIAEKFRDRFSVPICQHYGCTEVGAISFNTQDPVNKPLSVGLPIYGTQIEVRDERGRPLNSNETGDIWIRSAAMATCYGGLPQITSDSFRDGYFCAGDTGFIDDEGFLFLTGRKNVLVNVAGLKVDPGEVEDVLLQHAAVTDLVVLGVAHVNYGEQLKAFVVLEPEQACSVEEIRTFAAAHLAEYKVPTVIEFVDKIPRSPVGKILRKYLV